MDEIRCLARETMTKTGAPGDCMLKTTVDVREDSQRMSSDCDRIRHRSHVTAFPRWRTIASRRVLKVLGFSITDREGGIP